MNYNYLKILIRKIQSKHFLIILFLTGFLITGIRIENYFYVFEDYYYDLVPANNELVKSDQQEEKLILTDYDNNFNELIYSSNEAAIFHSYTIPVYSYNCLLFVKFKTLITKPVGSSNIISILQNSNTWHKSSEEGPALIS